jgi:hypothetical protein
MASTGWRRWIGLAAATSLLVAGSVGVLVGTLFDSDHIARAVTRYLMTWTGQPVAMGQVDLVWLPTPRVRIQKVRFGNVSRSNGRPLLTARAVSMNVSLLALFFGRIVLHSLEIDAPEVSLDLGPGGAPIVPSFASIPDSGTHADDVSVLITHLHVENGSARIGRWTIESIRMSGTAPVSAQSARLELSAKVTELGELDGHISVSTRPEGGVRWESRVEMPDLTLAGLAASMGTESMISGSGRAVVVASGENGKLGDASLDLGLRAVDFEVPSLRVQGDVDVSARLGGPWTLDLADAQVELANVLTKAPGVPAQVDGLVPRVGDSNAWDSWTLRIGSDELRGDLRLLADGPHVGLSGSIDFASLLGWSTASGLPPKGRLSLTRIEYAPPMDLSGEGRVDRAVLPVGPDCTLSVSGPFNIEGSMLRTSGSGVELLGERIALRGSYDFARDEIDVVARADGVELGRLSEKLQGKAKISGRLYGRVELHGAPRLNAITGKGDISVENGEILNISLLTLLTSPSTRAPDQEPFRGLRGRFILRDQKLDFSDLVLEQFPASASLRGSLSLTDGSLNLEGDVRYGVDRASTSSRIWVTGSIQQLQWSLDSEYPIDRETRWKMERETLEGIKRAIEDLDVPPEPDRAAAYRNQIQVIERELERYAHPDDAPVP